jgi:hypothetical protein
MELEALGAISGKVLDAGCGLGDNVSTSLVEATR